MKITTPNCGLDSSRVDDFSASPAHPPGSQTPSMQAAQVFRSSKTSEEMISHDIDGIIQKREILSVPKRNK